MTQESVITRILRHLKLASVPPPIAPARVRQATFDWVASAHDVARGLVSAVRAVEVCLTPLSATLPLPAVRVQAALRRAAGRSSGAAAARWVRRQRRGHGVAAGGGRWEARGRGGGAKRAFILPIRFEALFDLALSPNP